MPDIEIALDGVRKEFPATSSTQTLAALSNVDLAVAPHEVVCVIGPSGCGKSTILNLLAGFIEPTEGRVLLRGHETKGISRERIVVFQTPVLFPWMTVLGNVCLVGKARGVDSGEIEKRAMAMLSEVGLAGFTQHYPYQLSGGMRQRLQLARALTAQPEVLLLDEPFGALDAQTRLTMQELLQGIVIHHAPTVVFVTHDIEEALFLGDRVYLMSGRPGRIVDEIPVSWPRPRTLDTLTDQEFVQLRTDLLARLRQTVIEQDGIAASA